MDDRWLSVDDISTYLGIKRDTVYKWIERRRMPAHKVGRLWKFSKQEVDAWVCSDRSAAQSLPPGTTTLGRTETPREDSATER